ncbi:MAG: hypothetical protein ACO2PK_03685, partial [Armatimonadota bacterium]
TAFPLVIPFGRRVVQRTPVYSVRLPLSVQKGVGHDGGDPSDEAIFRLEAVKGAPRLRQRFRQQILSVVTITRQSVSDAVERRLMGSHQALKLLGSFLAHAVSRPPHGTPSKKALQPPFQFHRELKGGFFRSNGWTPERRP